MGYLITMVLFILAGWLAGSIGFAVNTLTGYVLVGGVIMVGADWLRGL